LIAIFTVWPKIKTKKSRMPFATGFDGIVPSILTTWAITPVQRLRASSLEYESTSPR